MTNATNATHADSAVSNYVSLFFGFWMFVIGAMNLVLVHPVPGAAFLLLACLYIPAVNVRLRKTFGFGIPLAVKIALGVIGIWFTLGVSDLGDMMDKL